MGSWYNLTGEPLSNCVNSRCGLRPVQPSALRSTPNDFAEYEQKMANWNKCYEVCKLMPSVQSTSAGRDVVTADSGRDAITNDTRPFQVGASDSIKGDAGLSTNMKIGLAVGALAIIGVWWFTRKK